MPPKHSDHNPCTCFYTEFYLYRESSSVRPFVI